MYITIKTIKQYMSTLIRHENLCFQNPDLRRIVDTALGTQIECEYDFNSSLQALHFYATHPSHPRDTPSTKSQREEVSVVWNRKSHSYPILHFQSKGLYCMRSKDVQWNLVESSTLSLSSETRALGTRCNNRAVSKERKTSERIKNFLYLIVSENYLCSECAAILN